MTGGMHYTPSHTNVCKFFNSVSTHKFSADITPEELKLCNFTKVKVFFLVLVYDFNFDLFEFSAAMMGKGLLSTNLDTNLDKDFVSLSFVPRCYNNFHQRQKATDILCVFFT